MWTVIKRINKKKRERLAPLPQCLAELAVFNRLTLSQDSLIAPTARTVRDVEAKGLSELTEQSS